VHTDLFTPGLRGLLAADPVKTGDAWKVSTDTVRELTDMQVEKGSLECRLLELIKLGGRQVGHVSLSGSVQGVSEDGPVRHEIDGRYYFDLESNHLSYISFQGKQTFLDKEGKPTGTIEGTFTMTRQVDVKSTELADDAIRGVKLEPNDDNT